MFRTSHIIGLTCLSVALSACGQAPEISRASSNPAVVASQAPLTTLSRAFHAQAPYTVNFDFDYDTIDAEAAARLNAQADWILSHPDVKFRVYGHADKVGTNGYNKDLAMRRAERVVGYLVSRGIDASRVEAVVSLGEEVPIVSTEAPERLNRRVLTDVFGYTAPVPTERRATERSDTAPMGLRMMARQNERHAHVGTAYGPVHGQSPAAEEERGDVRADVIVSGPTDNGPTDNGPTDNGPTDNGPTDNGPTDNGPTDNGPTDNGPTDNGPTDNGPTNDTPKKDKKDKRPNAGRGNGDEAGDPGKSEGKNKGGDEL